MTVREAAPAAAITFRVNGRPVDATVPGGRRLIDVLRLDLGLTGTKEGCGEGECGACSVLLDGELVNSCLVPVAQVDGRDVRTVEGLAGEGELDPLQRAFLEAGGTQCGLCAPGMLLAARALLASGRPVTDGAIREAIAGNLCRCTGYTKIVESIATAAELAEADAWSAWPQVAGSARPVEARAMAGGTDLVRPASLDEALARLAERPGLRPVAGATDLFVGAAPGSGVRPPAMLDLAALEELRGISVDRGELVLGALTTYSDLRRSPIVGVALPVLGEAAATVGATQIQNRGTVGGNCVTASPAGDLLPILLATDARLELAGPVGRRCVPAASFWTGYRETALRPGELLVAVRIPLQGGRRVRFRKVGTRQAQAIAKVSIAVAWRCDLAVDGGPGPWRDVRVALGAVADRPIRAPRTEAILEGAAPGPEVASRAAAMVQSEVSPIDDVRSTAVYRRAVSGQVLRRIVLDAAG